VAAQAHQRARRSTGRLAAVEKVQPLDAEVPAIDGSKARVKVPGGTQTGRRFRLTSKGMPVLRSMEYGDLYIQASVETPQNLTRRQRELLAEFEAESSNKTQPESSGFFAKMKEFFEGLS